MKTLNLIKRQKIQRLKQIILIALLIKQTLIEIVQTLASLKFNKNLKQTTQLSLSNHQPLIRNQQTMQLSQQQIEEHDKSKKVQEKIKLMMKYKKMHKLTSNKDLASEKHLSTFNDKASSSKFEQLYAKQTRIIGLDQHDKYREQETFETYSSKRTKSINEQGDIGSSTSFSMKDSSKKFILSHKQGKGIYETSTMKRVPSAQKIESSNDQCAQKESFKKLKRPSSVMNKSTRATTSRTKRQKPSQVQDQKIMEEKIRQIIPNCFEHGIKLQKYSDDKGINLMKEYEILMSEEVNILRLVNNSRKYCSVKLEDEEEQQTRLSNGVEKEIIEMLKKKREKETVISKCESLTDQIARLIDARLSALNKTKATSF